MSNALAISNTAGGAMTNPAPTVTSATPATGAAAGGEAITDLAGTDFRPGATVTFGGVAATSVVVVSRTRITCVTPAHAAGVVNVVVTNPDGRNSGTGVGVYEYV